MSKVDGVICAPVRGPATTPMRPMNATPAQMLAGIVRARVRTEVCALYLPNAGVGSDALIEGCAPLSRPTWRAV